jgi:replicative DNA helicase
MNTLPRRRGDKLIEIEQIALGRILWKPSEFKHMEKLTPEDFQQERHSAIFRAIRTLVDRNVEVGFVELRDELEARNELEMAGGVSYLTYLPLIAIGEQIQRDNEETDLILYGLRRARGVM